MTLSPLFSGCCRFEPSCSNYAIEALQVHGAWKGLWLTARRLLRLYLGDLLLLAYGMPNPSSQDQPQHQDYQFLALVHQATHLLNF